MQTFVDSASANAVSLGAISIKNSQIIHNRLIDPTNPLLGNDLDLVITNHVNGVQTLSTDEIATYLSSSCVIHSLDGWVYLAHSIESLLKGDKGISVHLAYYAELRASMSFLSYEGIGVLNHKHFCVNSTGNLQTLTGGAGAEPGTHNFAWKALQHYILSNAKPKDNILKIFSFQGKNFKEWLSAIPNANLIMADQVIKDWLKDWSFDVNLFQSDKNLRNEVSYRPKKLNDNYLLNLQQSFEKLTSIWNLLEPQSVERFKLLDQYLLKKFFKKIHYYIEQSLGRPVDFNNMLDDTFNNSRLALTPTLKSFFNSSNDHQLFNCANNTAVGAAGIDPISVIARATLMLRLTTGCSSNLFKDASIVKNDLNFLFDNIGANNGFWPPTNIPNDFIDLWPDVEDALSNVNSWFSGRTTDGSFLELNNELANELIFYKQINRASLWGFTF